MDFPPVELNEKSIKVEVVMTRNRNAYASVRNESIIIKIPEKMRPDSAYKVALNLYKRIKKGILAKPERYLYDRKEEIKFHDNETINIMGRTFVFHISNTNLRNARASINGNQIYIRLPESFNIDQADKAVSYLSRRIISKEMETAVEERVNEANRQYFGSDLKEIKITNASSRWGSCTTTRNFENAKIFINFKLLFMPIECMDYVIVHELAHTKVHNHSRLFWSKVSKIIPDYKQRIKILKENAYKLRSRNNPQQSAHPLTS